MQPRVATATGFWPCGPHDGDEGVNDSCLELKIWDVAVRPRGSGVVVAICAGRHVQLWECSDGMTPMKQLWTSPLRVTVKGQPRTVHGKSVRRVSWSDCGTFLAAACFDSSASLWRVDDKATDATFLGNMLGQQNEIKSVSFAPRVRNFGAPLELRIATSSRDRSVWIHRVRPSPDWDTVAFECVDVLMGHTQDVKATGFRPIPSWFKELYETEEQLTDRTDLFASDNPFFFSASFGVDDDEIISSRLFPETVWSVSYDQSVRFWSRAPSGMMNCERELDLGSGTVWDLAYRSCGTEAAAVTEDGSLVFLRDVSISRRYEVMMRHIRKEDTNEVKGTKITGKLLASHIRREFPFWERSGSVHSLRAASSIEKVVDNDEGVLLVDEGDDQASWSLSDMDGEYSSEAEDPGAAAAARLRMGLPLDDEQAAGETQDADIEGVTIPIAPFTGRIVQWEGLELGPFTEIPAGAVEECGRIKVTTEDIFSVSWITVQGLDGEVIDLVATASADWGVKVYRRFPKSKSTSAPVLNGDITDWVLLDEDQLGHQGEVNGVAAFINNAGATILSVGDDGQIVRNDIALEHII